MWIILIGPLQSLVKKIVCLYTLIVIYIEKLVERLKIKYYEWQWIELWETKWFHILSYEKYLLNSTQIKLASDAVFETLSLHR